MLGEIKKRKKKIARPAKVFIYALSLAALAGGAYLTYDKIRKKRLLNVRDEGEDTSTAIDTGSNNVLPETGRQSAKGTDNFPLKRGSRGARVTMLQQALSKIIGAAAMKANGGIDGQFGPGTAKALKKAGYPEIIDETTFNKITGNSISNLQIVFDPRAIATRLYQAAQGRNLDTVLLQLKQIKTVSDYSSVNEYYKKQSFISKTIVTDLLDFVFKADEEAKKLLRNEFLRIGLKTNTSGKWSLQGIPLYKDLITLRQTFVIDEANNRIPVRKNTILGDELRVQNGMTWFKAIDNNILRVPTQDVKYT